MNEMFVEMFAEMFAEIYQSKNKNIKLKIESLPALVLPNTKTELQPHPIL